VVRKGAVMSDQWTSTYSVGEAEIRRKLEYMIVESISKDYMENKVKLLIQQGWEPLGGIEYSRSTQWIPTDKFFQAMVKETYGQPEE
jgi:hypothetical protein